ncbi:hypothetical protein [Costertonia aggregata]|uniref:DUF2383 domain-containing protein n=1 Tax=Costertonia aggregata TaxID=343403 RepID=A0A7H9ASW3_9FLAO|nr:hypothetical protein [Costertonia aggregata]QLG46568.1 hypothetical protein HYG79_14830 [Costertonia aggregata]
MANNLIDELNKILTNTLNYQEALSSLAESVSHEPTKDKLVEFARVAEKESKTLMQVISENGGQIESTARQTDQEAISWMPRTSPDPSNMQSVLESLIEAERNKEGAYQKLLSHENISRKMKNALKNHRLEAEANLKHFQSALQAIEKKQD